MSVPNKDGSRGKELGGDFPVDLGESLLRRPRGAAEMAIVGPAMSTERWGRNTTR